MSSVSWYGADVGKGRIAVARHGDTQVRELANAPAPIAQWLLALPAGAALAMEATGAYHLLLAGLAHAHGLRVYVINPQHLKHYAQAVGARAKTDRVDAQLIARYLAVEHSQLRAWAPAAPVNQQLAQMLGRRAALVRARAAIEQSLGSLAGLKTEREALLGECKRMISALERLIVKTIQIEPKLTALYARLRTIVGVGPILAAQLTEVLSRLRFNSADAFIAYSGLDPRPDESGQRRGRRRLSKHGSTVLRQLLWMAGLTTSHSKLWRPSYRALRARGLASTEAAVIMARKIARIAYAIARSEQTFDPVKFAHGA